MYGLLKNATYLSVRMITCFLPVLILHILTGAYLSILPPHNEANNLCWLNLKIVNELILIIVHNTQSRWYLHLSYIFGHGFAHLPRIIGVIFVFIISGIDSYRKEVNRRKKTSNLFFVSLSLDRKYVLIPTLPI